MTRRNTGGFLSAKEQATDSNSANGIFTLSEAAALTTGGKFPVGTFTPNRSARFRSAASAFLSRTPTTAGNSKTFTISFWFKRGLVSTSANFQRLLLVGSSTANYFSFLLGGSGSGTENDLSVYVQTSSAQAAYIATTAKFRDPAAWYHVVIAVDTTKAAASSRVKLYINSVQQTSFTSAAYPAQNTDIYYNSVVPHYIGENPQFSSNHFDGYLSEFNSIDGQQLTPTAFGQTDAATGTWVPKRYSGSYGTNGFYLPFNLEDSFITSVSSIEYLVVAGGGGSRNYGGGGGGQVRSFTSQTLNTGTPYTVTVGAGGAPSSDGANSVFVTNTSAGGKGTGGSGYSPGGASGSGFAGGTGANNNNPYLGGGGGGNSAVGTNASGSTSGSGGAGTSSSITGTSVGYGGGGGAGVEGGGSPGAGATTFGGGNGAPALGTGNNGTANRGGGAGGDQGQQSARYSGGSGVVIIKIPDTRSAHFSGGVTFTGGTASGGFKIYSVTATSTTSETVIIL